MKFKKSKVKKKLSKRITKNRSFSWIHRLYESRIIKLLAVIAILFTILFTLYNLFFGRKPLTYEELKELNEEFAERTANIVIEKMDEKLILHGKEYSLEEIEQITLKFGDVAANDYDRGIASFNLSEYKSAISSFNKSLSLGYKTKNHYYYIGTSYLFLNNYNEGRKWLLSCEEDFVCLGNIGASYAIEDNYSQAIDYLEKSISKLPTPLGYYNIGTVYSKIGNNESYKKAINYFDLGLKYDDKSFNMFSLNKNSLKLNKAYCLMKLEKLNESLKLFKEIEATGRNDLKINVNLAINYIELKDYYNAEIYARNALRLDPLNLDANKVLLVKYYDSKEYDKVVEHYENNQDLLNDYHSLSRVGGAYIALGHTDKGINILESLLDSCDEIDMELIYVSLSAGYMKKRLLNKALINAKKALDLNPKNEEAAYNLRIILNNILDKDKILNMFNELGKHLFKERKYKEASIVFSNSINIDSLNFEAIYYRGLALTETNENNEAINMYKRAIQINPKIIESYINLAVLLKKENRIDEAIEIYKQAILVDSCNSVLYCNWGNLLRDIKEYEMAIEKYLKVLEIDPKYFSVYFSLHYCYLNINRHNDAIKILKNCYESDLNNEYLTTLKLYLEEYLKKYSQKEFVVEANNLLEKVNKKIEIKH